MWKDIVSIVFICVTMNHLGLVEAVEKIMERELPIVNCIRCFTFWSVLIYSTFATHDFVLTIAISFLSSYSAIWLELLEGYIDTLYNRIYDKIYPDTTTNDKTSTTSTLPIVPD